MCLSFGMAQSGWVKSEGPERLGDHVSPGVLMLVFPPREVDAAIDRTGAAGQRNRLLPERMMVYYVMALAMFSSGSYEEVMRSLLAGMEWNGSPAASGLDDAYEGRDLQGPHAVGVRRDDRPV